MRATLTSLFALLVGAASLNLGLGLQASLLGVRARMEGFPVLVTGLIMSSYYVGFVLGSLWCPRLIRRVGHIRTFSALASVASAGALCHAAFVDPIWWVFFRGATGFCFAGLAMVAESWLNVRADNTNRGTLLAVYMIAILGGTTGGQLLLNVAPVAGYDLFVLVSVVISLSLVPVALTTTTAPAEVERNAMAIADLFRKTPLGVLGCASSGLLLGSFWSLGAVYARDVGLGTFDISLFMTCLVFGGTVLQWPLGRISDLADRRGIIAGQCLLLAVGGAMMSLEVVPQGTLLFLFIGIFGGLLLPLYALSVAHVNDYLEAAEFVPASATLLLIYGVGAVVGPLVSAALMTATGPRGLFLFAVLVGLGTAAYSVYRMRRRAPAEQPESFVAVPRTTPVAYQLDPRTPGDGLPTG